MRPNKRPNMQHNTQHDNHRNFEQLFRYGVNGLVATGVHYGALVMLIEQFRLSSAGAANLLAALIGICVSFLGNRYFVFKQTQSAVFRQAWRFSLLYGAIALVHGAVLFLWADWLEMDYRLGFVMATIMQFVLSYTGNRLLVFK